jgi:hypothetical protein
MRSEEGEEVIVSSGFFLLTQNPRRFAEDALPAVEEL